MAVDIFMKIDGISGESSDSQFKDWIEVLSINWELDRFPDKKEGTPGGLSSCPLGIIKVVDKATPQIFAAMTRGENIKEIQIALCRSGQEKVKYLEYVLTDCVITKFVWQTSNSSGESLPTENIQFRFKSIRITYIQQKRDTGGSAGQLAHEWSPARWS